VCSVMDAPNAVAILIGAAFAVVYTIMLSAAPYDFGE
jgi:hypothetical protein